MKEENREDKQKLKDFLNQKPEDAADDFEKEALEGFGMLNSEKEITELKERTDRKVNEALLTEESRAPFSRYWYAAAGLLLCIGLSVFFVMKTNKETGRDLAINQDLVKPKASPTHTEDKVKTQESQPLGEKDQKKPDKLNTGSDANGPGFKDDAFAKNQSRAAKKTEETTEKMHEAESNANAMEPMAYGGAGKGDNTVAALPTQPSSKAVVSENKTSDTDLDYAAKEERTADMKSPGETALQEVEMSRTSKAKSEPRKKMAKDDALAAPSAQIDAASVPTCYYSGDVGKLLKDLKKELKKKDLDRNFKARLHINTKNQVEEVEMLSENVFTKQEKEELDKILKKIENFKNTTKNTGYYTLDYKS